MLVFSQQLFFGLGVDDWTTPETNVFLSNYIGAAGDAVDNLADVTYAAKGAAGTAFAGQAFQVIPGHTDRQHGRRGEPQGRHRHARDGLG